MKNDYVIYEWPLSEDEEEKFSSPAPEASPAPPAPAAEEVPKKKVPTSPEPTKKLSTPPSSEPEVNLRLHPF